MEKLARIYTDTLKHHFENMYASWPPGRPVRLGDYGVLDWNLFNPLGNVGDLGIEFKTRMDDQKDDFEFRSKSGVELTFSARGSVTPAGTPLAKATLQLDFSKESSIFFTAADCVFEEVADKVRLSRDILERFKKGEWKQEWVVVTSVIRSGATTIVTSAGASSSAVLEAVGEVDRIDLADASIKLGMKQQRNVGLQIVTREGLQPLMGMSQVQAIHHFWPFVAGHDLKPKYATGHSTPAETDQKKLAALVQQVQKGQEKVEDHFFFGSLR